MLPRQRAFPVHSVRRSDGTIRGQGSLHILTRKGRGGRVKNVNVMLTDEGIKFFRSITQGRNRIGSNAAKGRWF